MNTYIVWGGNCFALLLGPGPYAFEVYLPLLLIHFCSINKEKYYDTSLDRAI